MPINFPSPALEGDTHPDTGGKNWLFMDGAWGSAVESPITVASIPRGTIVPYGGAVAPTDWLLCDGSPVDRTAYADLYLVIGDTFGAGDGTTTFNLPDYRDVAPSGASTTNIPGAVRGAESVTLITDNVPSHAHTATFSGGAISGSVTGTVDGQTDNRGNHTHGYRAHSPYTGFQGGSNAMYNTLYTDQTNQTGDHVHNVTGTISGSVTGTATGSVTVDAAGLGVAFSVLNPVLHANFIIKA